MTNARDSGAVAELEVLDPSYDRIVKSQLVVNISQVDELKDVLRLQHRKLRLLTFFMFALLLVMLPLVYVEFQNRELAAGAVNVIAVFTLFAICKIAPLWYSTFGVIWKIQCLLLIQFQAIRLAETELEGGVLAGE